jgi:hypothetical protein
MHFVSDVFWSLVFVAYPVYFLLRAAYRGMKRRLLPQLPGKLFAAYGVLAIVTKVIADTKHLGGNQCQIIARSGYMYVAWFVFGFFAVVYLARYFVIEERIAGLLRVQQWYRGPVQSIDSVLGGLIGALIAPWILWVTFSVLGFPNSAFLDFVLRVSSFVISSPFAFINTLVGDFLGIGMPSIFGGVQQLAKGLNDSTAGNYFAAQSECLNNLVRDTSSDSGAGIYLLWMVIAVLLLPAVIALSFDPLLYIRRLFSSLQRGSCSECHGRGVYGIHRPLLIGALCDRCMGSGTPVRPHLARSPDDAFYIPLNPSGLSILGVIVAGYISCGLIILFQFLAWIMIQV